MSTPAPPVAGKGDGGKEEEKKSEGDNVFKAPECPVKKVTVYADRAEVCRSLETRVKQGINEVVLRSLPSVIVEDSIRVEGQGHATIAEVFFRTRHVAAEEEQQAGEEEKELKKQLKELQEKEEDIASRQSIIKNQLNILEKFADSATKPPQSHEKVAAVPLGDSYFSGVTGFLSLYGTEAEKLQTARIKVEREKEANDQKLKAVRKNLDEVCRKRQGTVTDFRECTVVLEAEGEAEVMLSVSYVVMEASWEPSYDIRMYTADGKMKIQYYGQIRQNTGEDWQDAKLFLSTATPSIGGSVPLLATLQLSLRKFRRTKSKRFGAFSLQEDRTFDDSLCLRSCGLADDLSLGAGLGNGYSFRKAKEKPQMSVAAAKVEESTTSTTYEIARPSTIPSDNSEHRVTVGLIDVTPTLEYLSVPKMAPHAFLQARVTNSSPFALLPGPTSIFLDNAFVAKAELQAVAPQEEFECSLGVDPSVRVTYKPLKKYSTTSGLISKTSSTTHEQVTEIKNLHDYKIKVTVRDQLPRSTEDKIKVHLLEPKLDVKHPEKTPGVRLTKAHHLEWELELEKQQSRELLAKYVVELPSGEDYTSREVLESSQYQ